MAALGAVVEPVGKVRKPRQSAEPLAVVSAEAFDLPARRLERDQFQGGVGPSLAFEETIQAPRLPDSLQGRKARASRDLREKGGGCSGGAPQFVREIVNLRPASNVNEHVSSPGSGPAPTCSRAHRETRRLERLRHRGGIG